MPEGWAWCRLLNVGEIITGGTPNKNHPEYYGNAFPFFKPADLDQGRKTIIPSEYLSEEGKSCCRIIPKYSTVVCCIGSIGKCGYLNVEGTTNQQINSIIPNIDSLYLYYFCSSDCFTGQLLSLASATTIAIVNKSKMESVLIPVPTQAEQKRIAHILETTFGFIEAIEAKKADILLAIYNAKSKILDLAIRGKLVPQDPSDEPASVLLERIRAEKEELIKQGKIKRDKKESVIFKGDDNSYYEKINGNMVDITDQIPFDLPAGWAWDRLGNIASIARGGSPRPIKSYLSTEANGVNWIKIGDAEKNGKYIFTTKEKIKPEGVSKSRYVKSGDFLLTNSMSFGRPYILKTNGCIHDGWLVIGNIEAVFNQDYLYYALSADFMYKTLSGLASGSTVDNLNSDLVKSLLFPIPPLKEQIRIAEGVCKIENILSNVEASLN